MYTFQSMIKKIKRTSSVLAALEDIFAFLTPILWTWFVEIDSFAWGWDQPHAYVATGIAVIYILYLSTRISNIYKLSNDKRNAYRKQFMEQLDSVTRDQYNMLCQEIFTHKRQGNDLLLYDAHGVIRNILAHIKQLIANITEADLTNISVNFIYKYIGDGEYWQTIDGSSSCSIGELDDIVERGASMYHYLYANNQEYFFFNDKASVDWHMYTPSIRDGSDKATWGSIYCKRVLCTLHQDRFVDGILAVSTYNEKFTSSKHKAEIAQIEDLINEAISVFECKLKSEMTSLYIRHEYIKQNQIKAIDQLIALGHIPLYDTNGDKRHPEIMSENERILLLDEHLPLFKSKYNMSHKDFFLPDVTLDQKTLVTLAYEQQQLNSTKP